MTQANEGIPDVSWYVAYTNIKSEQRAEHGLLRKGFATFLPMRVHWAKRGRKKYPITGPMFPRYLFVGFGMRCSWLDFSRTHGVEGVLANNGAPLKIAPTLIGDLQAIVSSGEFDERLPPRMTAGAHVKFMRGPFEGHEGRCQSVSGEMRAEILIELLNREVVVKIALDELVLIS